MRAEGNALIAWAAGLTAATAARFLVPAAASLSAACYWVPAIAIIAHGARKLAAGPSLPAEIQKANLEGKVIVVTGAAAGLGFESALFFALRGATVILGGRSVSRNEDTAKRLREAAASASNNKLNLITKYAYDAEDLNGVRQFAVSLRDDLPVIDVLLANAGMIDWSDQIKSRHHPNIEYTACINSFAPILLTEILMEKLKKDATRVVVVSSMAHRRLPKDRSVLQAFKDTVGDEKIFSKMSKWSRYGISKLWNIYHTDYLVSKGIAAATLHPGVCASNFVVGVGFILEQIVFALGPWIMFKTQFEGAWTQIYLSLCKNTPPTYPISDEAKKTNDLITKKSAFYCDSAPHNTISLTATGNDAVMAEAVMKWSLEQIKPFMSSSSS